MSVKLPNVFKQQTFKEYGVPGTQTSKVMHPTPAHAHHPHIRQRRTRHFAVQLRPMNEILPTTKHFPTYLVSNSHLFIIFIDGCLINYETISISLHYFVDDLLAKANHLLSPITLMHNQLVTLKNDI